MRIALVSPYSWTFPGGVTRHIDALAREFLAEGHHVRVLSPVDPDDRLTRALHRRAPDPAPVPDYVVPLGRTVSLPDERRDVAPRGHARERRAPARRSCAAGDFDVIHVHEPIAPVVGWDACTLRRGRARGRHVPRVFVELATEHDRAHDRRAARVQPAARADRGIRGRALDGRALLRRHVRRDPQRRRPGRRAARVRSREPTRCASCSSGARRSARACPSCCPHSPACASTSRCGCR